MDISATVLFETYDLTAKLVGQLPESGDDFIRVQRQFDDKRRQPDASIMVYGIYNAGKSTLINALIGDNLAKTGDIPVTDSIGTYIWNNTAILDTPGVDAPVEHETVTREQMLEADAIIFVVNPSGAAEEEKTLQVLIEILQARKKLFLVLNDKKHMDVETLTRLKNDIRIRLQVLAQEKGMLEILQDIPIMRVNAAMALKAKLENKPGLLRASDFPPFEEALTAFIATIDHQQIYQRLGHELSKFLDSLMTSLDRKTTSETVRNIDALLKNIASQQYSCRTAISDEIKRQRETVYRGCKVALRQDPQHAHVQIETLFSQAIAQVDTVQKKETDHLVQRFQDDIQSLEAAIMQEAQQRNRQVLPQTPVEQAAGNHEQAQSKHGIDTEMVNNAVTSLGSLARPEHIVDGLKLVKDWIPSLMKGIGPKTMEKWGAAVVGKWIPYVGPAITVISSLWDIFSEDSDNKKAREQNKQQHREWERYQQEVDDFAHTTASQFESAISQMVAETLDPWFSQQTAQIRASRDNASQQDKALGDMQLEAQRLSLQLRDFA